MAPHLPHPFEVDESPVDRHRLRVAVVTETWPPEVNGVAHTLSRTVAGLQARQHAVQLIRPRQVVGEVAGQPTSAHPVLPQAFDEVLTRGLPVPRYPGLRMGLPARGALWRLWRDERPDVVHIATEGPLGWSALQAALRLNLPVSSDFRTNFHAYTRHYGAAWLHKPIASYLRHFHNRTQCTMVPTDALRRTLADEGFANLRVVARGVDTTQFTPSRRSEALRRSWGAGPDTPVAICVGRLAPEKNLSAMQAALAAMRGQRPDTVLVMVGDGPARAEMQARCPQAVFTGVRTGEDLAAHYASADICLFPSQTETFGNVTPEAMASGLALLAFDLAAASQMVRNGHNGLLAEPARMDSFCQLAAGLVADLPRARRLGEQAAQAALSFGWDRVVSQVESVLTSLAATSASPVRESRGAPRTAFNP